jgi:diguanylate cyclase (GGDEF)-like protein
MGTPLRALIIEDSEDDTLLLMRELRSGGYEPEYERVDSAAGLTSALERREWDIVFCDYTLPRFGGAQALAMVRERGLDVPFIFVSGTIGEETAVQMMKLGANDYLMKGNLRRLLPAVERELREAQTRGERRRATERLSYLVHHDVLTGLPNRVLFLDRLGQAIHEANRHGRVVGVLHLDVDRFKSINGSLGHAAGDELLKAIAARLGATLRPGDTVARLSGDEFTLLLSDMARVDDAATVARKILDSLAQPFEIAGRELHIGASLGITLFPADSSDAEELLRNADAAMRRAKEAGGNNHQFYTPEMTARAAENLALENGLRHALEHDELRLHYQPVMETVTGHLVGAEALVRWRRGPHGLVPPDRFIPLAEETGLIVQIGEWVLRTACARCRTWEASNGSAPRVAVNLSAREFLREDLAGSVRRVLREADLEPTRLELEITENVLMRDSCVAQAVLGALRDAGVRLTLDDFGTGYSSLSYLKRFPIDTLKIDRSFVRDIPDDPNSAALVRAMITMAHSLMIAVVAEGVETQEQYEFLRTEGSDFIQGYFFSPPLPAEEFAPLLQQRRPAPVYLRRPRAPGLAPKRRKEPRPRA